MGVEGGRGGRARRKQEEEEGWGDGRKATLTIDDRRRKERQIPAALISIFIGEK